MSDAEALEELITEARQLKAQIKDRSETATVLGERFVEMGRGLINGALRADFPFEYCDVGQVRQLLKDLPDLRSRLQNLEFRIKSRTAI